VEQAPILHYCDIWNFFVPNYIIFWKKKSPKIEKYTTNFDNKLLLETLKFLKCFIFKEKNSVKENLLEYVGIFYLQHVIFKIIIEDWNVELAMLLTISGEKPPI